MWENYKKVKHVGEGGMGDIWLVTNTQTRLLYVAKYLKPELFREKDYIRFCREINALKSFNNENIIKIYDISLDIKQPGYIMEYCINGSLENMDKKNIDPVNILRQLCNAVEEVHKRGLIHRDIKPQNILFGADGNIRLSDFGLVVEMDENRNILTTSSWVSRGFSPPEQYINMAKVTNKADIFAIGAVYYYLLTGETIDVFSDLEDSLKSFKGKNLYILKNCLQLDQSKRWDSTKYIIDCFDLKKKEDTYIYLSLPTNERKGFILQKLLLLEPLDYHIDDAWVMVEWLKEVASQEEDIFLKEYIQVTGNNLNEETNSLFETIMQEGGN